MMIQPLIFVRRLIFTMNEAHDIDDVHANRIDHDEGLWESIPT